MKTNLIVLLLSACLVSPAVLSIDNKFAKSEKGLEATIMETPVAVAAVETPVEAIQSTIAKLNQLTLVAAREPQMIRTLVEQEIAPLFDFEYIADEVLLAVVANLGEHEVEFFADKLQQNMMSALVSKLTQVRSGSFRFVSARPIIGGAVAVQLQVNSHSSFAFNIDILFHQNQAQKWQIFDVLLNGDSLINYYQRVASITAARYGIYGMLGRF